MHRKKVSYIATVRIDGAADGTTAFDMKGNDA